jgi:hypothetical protein
VDFQLAEARLLELADWWRSQAKLLAGEPRSFLDRDDSEPPREASTPARGAGDRAGVARA